MIQISWSTLAGKIQFFINLLSRQYETWMECPTFSFIGESEEVYFRYLKHSLEASQVKGTRIHDARIAAICLSHGVDELWSADRDFSRFPGLTIRNPLV